MIKLSDILNELGVKVSPEKNLSIDVIKTSDSVEDDFIINRSKEYNKIEGVPVYYGFEPNPAKETSEYEITKLFNSTKTLNNVSIDELKKVVLLTAPSQYFNRIVTLSSTGNLNSELVNVLSQKYKVPVDKNLTMGKVEYYPQDMVNKEKYEKADPVTKKILDSFVKCLEKNFPGQKLTIKKSGYGGEGKCAIQSGGRPFLNPAYGFSGDINPNDKILVVDDFKIGGSSLREIFKILKRQGIPTENITGYVLGLKR
jgi:hypothetical protein